MYVAVFEINDEGDRMAYLSLYRNVGGGMYMLYYDSL